MIGKFITGKSFAGCIGYCLSDKHNRKKNERVNLLKNNYCDGNKTELIKQFKEVATLNARQSKPVLHITLSMAEKERLPDYQLIEIAEECAKEFGFESNQYLVVEHTDTSTHQHIHIVANRINFEGKTSVNDSNSFKRMADYCRKMERKYQLQQVLNPKTFLPKNQRLIPRNDKRKIAMKKRIEENIYESKSIDELSERLKFFGIETIKSRGISFIDDKGVKLKGSDIGFSLSKIQKIIQKNNREKMQTEMIDLSQRKIKYSRGF